MEKGQKMSFIDILRILDTIQVFRICQNMGKYAFFYLFLGKCGFKRFHISSDLGFVGFKHIPVTFLYYSQAVGQYA